MTDAPVTTTKPARWPRLVAAGLGLAWYLVAGGWSTLSPTNISWVFHSDWRQHWMGWLFFRDAPWTFPLGSVPSLLYPAGTSIGFTDSNPIVSILLKPFSPWLPAEFQFIGPWLAFCFICQGYFGAALASLVTKDKAQQVLAAMMFVGSPVLGVRMGHDTLCAQWILLALLYLGLREYAGAGEASRALWQAVALVAFAAGTHPYLAAMSFVLALAVFVRFLADRLCSPVRAAATAGATGASMLGMFWVIGYLSSGESVASSGFGDYSSDLLTLINPGGLSHVFLDKLRFPTQGRQWEGIGFLGLGGLAAVVMAAVHLITARPRVARRVWIMGGACVLLGCYALSKEITFAGTTILDVSALYAPFTGIVSAFRASGRFIWPLHYVMLLAGLWGVMRIGERRSPSIGAAALVVAVVLQITDLRLDRVWLAPKNFRQAPAAAFALAQGKFKHMALVPMQVLGVCGNPYEEDHAYRFMLLAYRLKLTYNSGIYARVDAPRIARACLALEQDVDAGKIDPGTIYVVAPAYLERFRALGGACGRFDGDWICVGKDSDERFRTLVATGK